MLATDHPARRGLRHRIPAFLRPFTGQHPAVFAAGLLLAGTALIVLARLL
ncbi:hypothetical protein [Kineosporia succinea]|uniref:Uncharacterized protein n=1 Tax=Kineosporia succinea TaxID=84632 RepID=A0ABT9PCJ4_9ACTN|nr:hypothetical protein [Kineosporia succinea]MDP9830425.1 hypothetical protein [Kineosporia succinea]